MPAADLKRRALIGALKYDIIGWIAVFFLKSSETDNVLIREGVFLAGAVKGPACITTTFADGRAAAVQIASYLRKINR